MATVPRLPDSLRRPAPDGDGLGVALGVVSAWLGCLLVLLSWRPEGMQWALAPLAVGLQTWLYTGLFITAHDAMHGTIAPGRPKLNDAIGHFCTRAYAAFSFSMLRTAHHRHHAAPASAEDPDWHDGRSENPVVWFLVFLSHYLSIGQILMMALAFNLMRYGADVPVPNLVLFWAVPAILSTLQLFFFGTWLPHHEPAGGHDNRHRARSTGWPAWASFLSCFHFGYHRAHHEYPGLPWWRLPRGEALIREAG